MPEMHLYEYAVLRVVPRVEREEFMNIGVILYCPSQRFLEVVYQLAPDRLRALAPDLDLEELETYFRSFASICRGEKKGGALGAAPPSSRFRWLTARRSTILQVSDVHPGLCEDPAQTLEKLMAKLVR